MKKVLVISNDVVDQKMAGVGVRNWEIANALAADCEVTLAIPNDTKLESPQVKLVQYDLEGGDLRELAGHADALVLGGFTLHYHPYLREMGVPIAVDLYVPNLLESLVWHEQDDLADWKPRYEEYLRVQLELLRAGDFFFCASDRQRDYWMGFLHAQKRINPHTYSADHALRRLIDVVPYGLPAEPLPERRPVLKGIYPGIPENAFLILWNGGLWDWLDPLTLVKAMALLENRLPQARLYFMGASHPDARIHNLAMPEQTIQLSKELGLYNRTIFFGEWAPYAERGCYLQEADLSAVLYADHIETRFSFRTRLLDCMWAGLPVVTNGGDELSELMVKVGVGERVPYGDPAAVAAAIELHATGKKASRQEIVWEDLRREFRWQNVTSPLLAFCQNPHLAEDKGQYQTDVERVTKDKDAFHEKVVKEKDDFLEKVVHDKDAFLEKVIHDKDAFLENVVQDKDTFLEQVVQDKDAFLIQVAREKDLALANAITERDGLKAILDRYHRSLPFRAYYGIRKLLNGKA